MHFGFSYIGLIFLLMLFIPNIIWSKNKPKDYDKFAKNENKVLLLFERIGEVLVTCIVLMFKDFNINTISNWSVIILVAFLTMILYEIYWIRYFRSDKTMKDFYSSFIRNTCCGSCTSSNCILFIRIIWRKYTFNNSYNNIRNRSYWNTCKS